MDKLLKGSLFLALGGAMLLVMSSPQANLDTCRTFFRYTANTFFIKHLSKHIIDQSYGFNLARFHDYYQYKPYSLNCFIH